MAIRRIPSTLDVATAARQRIKNVFANGVPVYMSFSGGKDSLALAHLVYSLIQSGEIDPALLTVVFIDEEAIFDCIEATTKEWRRKFLLAASASAGPSSRESSAKRFRRIACAAAYPGHRVPGCCR